MHVYISLPTHANSNNNHIVTSPPVLLAVHDMLGHRSPRRARRRSTHMPRSLHGCPTSLCAAALGAADRDRAAAHTISGRLCTPQAPTALPTPVCLRPTRGAARAPTPAARSMRAPPASRSAAHSGAAAGPRGALRGSGGRGGGGPGVDPCTDQVPASKGR